MHIRHLQLILFQKALAQHHPPILRHLRPFRPTDSEPSNMVRWVASLLISRMEVLDHIRDTVWARSRPSKENILIETNSPQDSGERLSHKMRLMPLKLVEPRWYAERYRTVKYVIMTSLPTWIVLYHIVSSTRVMSTMEPEIRNALGYMIQPNKESHGVRVDICLWFDGRKVN